MPDPEGGVVAYQPGAVKRREQKREHEAPDRVVEQSRGETIPRAGLARPAGLGALQLRHAQLENPARVLGRIFRAQEDALLPPPVQDRQVRLRDQRRHRRDLALPEPRQAVHDAIDQRECEQGQREPDQNLLRHQHRVDRRHEDDRCGDERSEEDAQRELSDGRAADRRDALGQARVVRVLFRRFRRNGQRFLVGDIDDFIVRRRAAGRPRDVAHEMRDSLLGRGLRRDGELLVVMEPVVRVAEYAAGMIYKAQRFFDVALPVTRFRVILSDNATQRGPHFLFRGELLDAERFVQRRFHQLCGLKRDGF